MSTTFIPGCVCRIVLMSEYMGAIPLPAARKNNCWSGAIFSGSTKNPPTPVVSKVSPGAAWSKSGLDTNPFCTRLTVMLNGSSSIGEDARE